ncbi:hypothetical protein EMPG_17666 [Blastomyces silverae]|uniref:Uncharacterized protein n=1 Tax=Blastomyces silverae TaxID=2060906 RepID=A0A0H1B603_9EURO|nr:hypothetical protein EMPG_17666 [Blastomyces silverae]
MLQVDATRMRPVPSLSWPSRRRPKQLTVPVRSPTRLNLLLTSPRLASPPPLLTISSPRCLTPRLLPAVVLFLSALSIVCLSCAVSCNLPGSSAWREGYLPSPQHPR